MQAEVENPKSKAHNLQSIIGLGVILLLAAVLRMGWPGITEFKLDEARAYAMALDMAEFKALPLNGTDMSVGLPNSPLAIYLYALPLFVWKSPLAANLFNGALNTAAVALVYWLTRRYWGTRAALITGLLYAVAPWAGIYSRKIWASNLLPLFIAGYVVSGLLVFVENRWRWLVVHLLLLSVIVQVHFSSAALAPVTLVLLLKYRKQVNWRLVGYGVAAALVLLAPFAWYLLTRVGEWQRATTFTADRSVQVSADALQLAALVVSGTYTHALAGPQAYQAFVASLPDFSAIFWIGGGLVLLGAGLVIIRFGRAWRQKTFSSADKAGGLLMLWLLMPLVFFTVHVSPVYPHYLTILFCLAYVLSGVGVDWLLERFRPAWQQALVWLIPLTIVVCQVWQAVGLLNFVNTYVTPGGFGVPLEKLMQAADTARGAGAQEILVVSDGSDTWADNTPAVFNMLLRDVSHRFVDGRTMAVFPESDTVVLIWSGNYPALELYRQWGGGQWLATVPLRAGEGEVRFARNANVSLAVPHPREASALLSNGAEVLGSGGNAQRWELWWRASDGAAEEQHVFAHLLDATGQRIAQADETTYPAQYWRANDLVVSYFALGEAAAGDATVRAGMYTYPALMPVQVLDAEGNPAGEWLEFLLAR